MSSHRANKCFPAAAPLDGGLGSAKWDRNVITKLLSVTFGVKLTSHGIAIVLRLTGPFDRS